MNNIQKQATEHYDKMIEYAKQQNYTDEPDMWQMLILIDETWSGHHCSYCDEYLTSNERGGQDCGECPLETGSCCNHLWLDMSTSHTWKEWIEHAEKVIQYIKDHGVIE